MIHIVAFFRTEIRYFGVKITRHGQIFTQLTPQLGIKAIKPPLSVFPTCQLSISWGLLVYRSFIFRRAASLPPPLLPLAPGFGSFTEKPVSYLIGVHLHSLIQQSHKSRESQGTGKKKKKKYCITQCAELLILIKTWDILRKMQKHFFTPLSHPMSVTVCS